MSNQPSPFKARLESLKNMLDSPSVVKQFSDVLKENKASFIASLIELYSSDSALQECEPKDLIYEALKIASLRFPLNKQIGFAWIMPFKKKTKNNNEWVVKVRPVFQIGYKGYIQLAIRSNAYRYINTGVVYEGEISLLDKLTGRIELDGKATSDIIVGYFAHIELLNGFSKTIFSSVQDIEKHVQKYVVNQENNSMWKSNYDSMACKTILKHLLSKYGYLSTELVLAISSEFDEANNPDILSDIKDKPTKKEIGFDGLDENEKEESETSNNLTPPPPPIGGFAQPTKDVPF